MGMGMLVAMVMEMIVVVGMGMVMLVGMAVLMGVGNTVCARDGERRRSYRDGCAWQILLCIFSLLYPPDPMMSKHLFCPNIPREGLRKTGKGSIMGKIMQR